MNILIDFINPEFPANFNQCYRVFQSNDCINSVILKFECHVRILQITGLEQRETQWVWSIENCLLVNHGVY